MQEVISKAVSPLRCATALQNLAELEQLRKYWSRAKKLGRCLALPNVL
jgi:hypothetical protein